jgi:hypothetical protein
MCLFLMERRNVIGTPNNDAAWGLSFLSRDRKHQWQDICFNSRRNAPSEFNLWV